MAAHLYCRHQRIYDVRRQLIDEEEASTPNNDMKFKLDTKI